MRRSALCLLALSASLAALPRAGAATIGVTMVPPVAFFGYLRDAMKQRAEQVSGTDIAFAFSRDGDAEHQVEQVRDYLDRKVDALIVLPVDSSASDRITAMAERANVPLIYVNNGPRADFFPGRVALVLPNDLVAGKLQMLKLATLMGGKGNLVIIRGPAGHAGASLRTQGILETLKAYPDIHVVGNEAADWDRKRAHDLMQGWLAAGHVDAVAANNDEMAIGARMAIREAGVQHVLVAGVDATPDGLAAMRSGEMVLSVYQNPQKEGAQAVDDALALLAGQSVPQYDWIDFALVTDRTLPRFQ